MEEELLLIVLAVILLVGCDAHGRNDQSKIEPQIPPVSERSEWETQPRYNLPLDIRVESPQAPEEVRRPSPPVPPDSPMPSGILSSLLRGNQK